MNDKLKKFLESPERVFSAINWLMIGGSLAALIFVPIPGVPAIKWLLGFEWLCFVALYLSILYPPKRWKS